ncbi:plasmid replication initiator TrfA [Francisellaceae bacterium]|nr:plasmid replication initiator TrfA [Francisellaceae bacterium]
MTDGSNNLVGDNKPTVQLTFDLITNELMNEKEDIEKFRVALKQLTLSSLFTTASKKQARERFSRKTIVTYDEQIQITYSGDELRTDDEDVFMCILTMASEQKLGNNNYMVETTHYKFLKMLNWPITTDYYDKLDLILDRFVASSLTVKFKEKNLKMSILTHTLGTGDDQGRCGNLKIFLSPHMQTLFTQENVTLIDSVKRNKMSALANKMLSILNEYPDARIELTVSLIFEISGSTATTINFKKMLKRSLKEMKESSLISSFVVTRDNKVIIDR